VLHGKAVGPRPFTGISRIASVPSSLPGFETPLATIRTPTSPDDTRAIVRQFIEAGADYIIFYDGALPLEYYQAGADEAHKLGKPVFARAYGPGMYPKDAALLGARSCPTRLASASRSRGIRRGFAADATTAPNWTGSPKWTTTRRVS